MDRKRLVGADQPGMRRQRITPVDYRPPIVPQAAETTTTQPAQYEAPRKKRLRHEERYMRITSYLERELHARLHTLHEHGEIPTFTEAMNAALKEYLERHFPLA